MNEFSFYEKGYTSRKATKNIDLQQIYEYIKNHPQKERILHLRTLSKDDYCYSKIKGTLPCITPHGTFQTSKKKENMILLSEYLYFDIDLMTIEESENIKDNLVGNYKKYIALIGKSVGGRGLFLYMKVKGLTPANFTSVQQYFIEDVFKEYPIDTNAKGITRCHVLPFDENVFYNEEHEYFQVPKELLYNTKNTTDSVYKKSNTTCYTPPSVFRDISEVWNKLTLKTAVDVGNNLFVIKPVDYYKLFIPANIQDGKKHKVFRGIVNNLVVLNPDIELEDVLSFINYVNINHTTSPMRQREMIRTINREYERIRETGELHVSYKVKSVHLNTSPGIRKDERILMANKVNGLLRTLLTLQKVQKAKEELLTEGNSKPKNKEIALRAGVTSDTVSRYKGKTIEAVWKEIKECNRVIE